MIEYLATLAVVAATGFFVGYLVFSSDSSKRIVEEMNAEEALRAKVRKSDAEASTYRAALILIRNQGTASKSGTARSMALKAKDALK